MFDRNRTLLIVNGTLYALVVLAAAAVNVMHFPTPHGAPARVAKPRTTSDTRLQITSASMR